MAPHSTPIGKPCPSCNKGKTIPCLQCDGHHDRPRAAGDRNKRAGFGYFYNQCPSDTECVCDPKHGIYNHGPLGCEGIMPHGAPETRRASIPNKLPVAIRNMKSQAMFKGYPVSKKHFEAAASQLGESYRAASSEKERAGVHAAANEMASFFKRQNPNFDHNRFHSWWKQRAGIEDAPAKAPRKRRPRAAVPQRARIVNSAWNNAPEDTSIPDKLPEDFGKARKRKPGMVDHIMRMEDGEASEAEGRHAMQQMVNEGHAWKMQGSYGRAAMGMIEAGHIALGHRSHRDYYGNRIPSRHEVEPGTKGSPEFVRAAGFEPDKCDQTCEHYTPQIPNQLPKKIGRIKKSQALFKDMGGLPPTPRCYAPVRQGVFCGHLMGDHYFTENGRRCGECERIPGYDGNHEFKHEHGPLEGISGNAKTATSSRVEIPHQLPEEIRNMKSQVIFKGRPSSDDDEIGTCCSHPKGAHNSYGCANCASEDPKRGRQGLWESVTDPSRYGGSAGHNFTGHTISGNVRAATSPVGYAHPDADPHSAPRTYAAQRHQILFDLHDKYHGTGREKPFYGPKAEPTEKSQRIFKARTPRGYAMYNRSGRQLIHNTGQNDSSSAMGLGGGNATRYAKEYRGYSNSSVGRMLKLRSQSSGVRGSVNRFFNKKTPKVIDF